MVFVLESCFSKILGLQLNKKLLIWINHDSDT